MLNGMLRFNDEAARKAKAARRDARQSIRLLRRLLALGL
jgi:hypothetical protein